MDSFRRMRPAGPTPHLHRGADADPHDQYDPSRGFRLVIGPGFETTPPEYGCAQSY
jgi:hypothetical protein